MLFSDQCLVTGPHLVREKKGCVRTVPAPGYRHVCTVISSRSPPRQWGDGPRHVGAPFEVHAHRPLLNKIPAGSESGCLYFRCTRNNWNNSSFGFSSSAARLPSTLFCHFGRGTGVGRLLSHNGAHRIDSLLSISGVSVNCVLLMEKKLTVSLNGYWVTEG